MVFSSISFLYFFLPIFLFIYYIVPNKLKNFVIFIGSVLFYGWGEPKYVLLMLTLILVSYTAGLVIEKNRGNILSKLALIVSLFIGLANLIVFKYFNFFILSFSKITGINIKVLDLLLPIGISFYTFQIISYVVDVFKNNINAEKNIIDLATYIVMFPQLIAGPIVRYKDIHEKIKSRIITFEETSIGAERFIIGLSKKVLIANPIGELAELTKTVQEKSILLLWLYGIAITFQIYYDFSGYSDMAIGLGKMLGFTFPENFNYPYISRSITEFWRRWHITLGSWFRDYVYIPLGGNRVAKHKWIFNILIVWILTGLWHGASWNFVVWGLMYGIILLFEKLFLNKLLNKIGIFKHIYVMLCVIIGFIIFDNILLSDGLNILKSMFGFNGLALSSGLTSYYFKSNFVLFIMGIIGATPLIKKIYGWFTIREESIKIVNLAKLVIIPLLLILVTAYIIDGSFNPFLYFRF